MTFVLHLHVSTLSHIQNNYLLKWCYDQILPLDCLVVSHSILWKNKNAMYHLQISPLVLDIFKFEKCVKYANKITDDVIH